MDLKRKAHRMLLSLLSVLFIGGGLLLYQGNDAIALGLAKKSGILTAEQVQMSFETVGGRITKEFVKEGQSVKKGALIMAIDHTDLDFAIEKAQAQLKELAAQIKGKKAAIDIGLEKTATLEQQTRREIDRQKAVLTATRADYQNKQLEYDRRLSLIQIGAISQSEMDLAQSTLAVARATVAQQQQILDKLLAGASDDEDTDRIALPTIREQRKEYENQRYDIENLSAQKKGLEIQLRELLVRKERCVLRAPEDGKILRIIKKAGEIIAPNTTVVLLESNRRYYDIYLSEQQAADLQEGDCVVGYAVANGDPVAGRIRLIAAAPGFADLKMSREKGQSDLSTFQLRIYIEENQPACKTGMTIEVKTDALAQR